MGEGTMPRLAINADGRGLALWQSLVGGERQILGKTLGSGESMGQTIFRTRGRIQHLQAAVDRRGNALVVWLHEVDGRSEVLAQAFDTRIPGWEKEPTSLGFPTGPALEPRIAVNHREYAMVLWAVQDSSFEGLVASHYWPADRIWSDRPVPVVAYATRHHQVAMDERGNALAIWVKVSAGERSSVEASHFDAMRCEWGEPVTLATAHSFSQVRLVMSGNGDALAAWNQAESHGTMRLYSKVFVQGCWSAERTRLDEEAGAVEDFALALGNDGRAGLLAFHHGAEEIWVSGRIREGAWSEAAHLGSACTLPRSAPSLRMGSQGASALWIQGEGGDQSLMLVGTR